jgi:hypothetical protein
MNKNGSEGEELASEELLKSALEFERDGAHSDALAILDRLLQQRPLEREVFRSAARSCFAACLDPTILATWPNERRDALFARLVLQEGTPTEVPALHACIASNHSARVEGALPRAAAALTPVLSSLWEQGHRGPSFLTMVLLLRRHLSDWPYSKEISQWHLDLLPQFDRSHMTLPYNSAFDQESFQDNVEDVKQALQSLSVEEIAQRFAPWQVLLFHWITGGRNLDQLLPSLLTALKQHDRGGDEASGSANAEALRSLSLRAAVQSGKASDLNSAAGSLARQWSELRLPYGKGADAERAAKRLESKPWLAIGAARSIVSQKMPYVKLGQRRPRIAVCVSGQLRGYRRGFSSWKTSILQGAECHFFVHTWKRVGRSGAEPFRAFLPFAGQAFCDAYRREANRIGLAETMLRYPKLFLRLVESGEITRDELCDVYATDHVVVEDDDADAFTGWSNSRKMHYKIAAAHDLADGGGSEFDLILRLRPDRELGLAAFVWSDIVTAAASPLILADIRFGHQCATPIVGDQLAVGSPKVMRVYADTTRILPQLSDLGMFECSHEFHGHASLARTCWHAGIDVRRLPVRIGRLLEADAMRADEIANCLAEDAVGRMNAMDRTLIEANRADLAA